MSNSRPCCTVFLLAASLLACRGEPPENAGTIVEQAIEASRAELTEDSASASTSTPGWLWSQVGRSPRHTSFNPYETYLTPDIVAHSSYLTIRPALVGIPRQTSIPPLASEWRIYSIAPGSTTRFAAFESSLDFRVWRSAELGPGDFTTAPAIVRGRLVAVRRDGFFSLSTSSTEYIYRAFPHPLITSDLAAKGDLVYMTGRRLDDCGDATRVIALRLDGTEAWAQPLVGHTTAVPAIADGAVYASDGAGQVRAFDAATGARLWNTARVAGARFGTPAVRSGRVYVVSSNRRLYAFDQVSGAKQWSARFDGETALRNPAVTDESVLVVSDLPHSFQVSAFDLKTGELRFAAPHGSGHVTGNIAVAGQVGYVGSDDGYLTMLRVDTGEQLGRVWLDGKVTDPIIVNGGIFVWAGRTLFGINTMTPEVWPSSNSLCRGGVAGCRGNAECEACLTGSACPAGVAPVYNGESCVCPEGDRWTCQYMYCCPKGLSWSHSRCTCIPNTGPVGCGYLCEGVIPCESCLFEGACAEGPDPVWTGTECVCANYPGRECDYPHCCAPGSHWDATTCGCAAD